MKNVPPRRERAVLVGTKEDQGLSCYQQIDPSASGGGLSELAGLVETAGAEVAGTMVRRREKPDAAFFIGVGKIGELQDLLRDCRGDFVVFDDDLTPVQNRNLQLRLGKKVLDRTGIILDIFAARARTKEAKLQVAKAQLEYLLPRLTGEGSALSRLGGGIGTRGPGETKLESDRRIIKHKIAKINRKLKEVRANRELQRVPREKMDWPVIALVGYTNAGKSTLFHLLTGAVVEIEDELFCTLDPTLRKLILPDHQEAFLIDTVGFIKGLPHLLVDSFRATLEETVQADLLLHVVNLGSPCVEEEYTAVSAVLHELEIEDKPVITVLNKKDLLDNEFALARLERSFPESVAISALTGTGQEQLLQKITAVLTSRISRGKFLLPYKQGQNLSIFHNKGRVLQEEYRTDGILLEAELPRIWFERVKEFML